MLQHERDWCARDQRAAETLEDIATEIRDARDLVSGGWMAVQRLDADDRDALGQLLDTIAKRLVATAEKLERHNRPEGRTHAA